MTDKPRRRVKVRIEIDADLIARSLTSNLQLALLELVHTDEWQPYPRHKGNKAAWLCYLQKREIAADAYAILGKSKVTPNRSRVKRSEPVWLQEWQFTKFGLKVQSAVRATIQAEADD